MSGERKAVVVEFDLGMIEIDEGMSVDEATDRAMKRLAIVVDALDILADVEATADIAGGQMELIVTVGPNDRVLYEDDMSERSWAEPEPQPES